MTYYVKLLTSTSAGRDWSKVDVSQVIRCVVWMMRISCLLNAVFLLVGADKFVIQGGGIAVTLRRRCQEALY